jgi:hypothetical protein
MFLLHRNISQTDIWRAKEERIYPHEYYYSREKYHSSIEGILLFGHKISD